jgi:lipopolysaccharide export system permease protein
MIPTFFLGIVVFVSILLMFQALRLTEFVIVHGVSLRLIAQMVGFLSISFLPILFPMSLLFSILMTYGRLSGDSELVAMRASGLSMWTIMAPALILSAVVGTMSLQTAFHLAPWGNRQFEVLITRLGSSKPAVTIREGTFSEGFFDLVVYANRVDPRDGHMSQVFIYDESSPKNPVTVIAQGGRILFDSESKDQRARLRLMDGSLHRSSEERHTKIDFSTYDLFFSDPKTEQSRSKSPPSLTAAELLAGLNDETTSNKNRLEWLTEYHKRIAISAACLIFGLIGVGLGAITHKRTAQASGTILSVGIIVIYWILYVVGEGLAKGGQVPPWFAMWFANILGLGLGLYSVRRVWS